MAEYDAKMQELEVRLSAAEDELRAEEELRALRAEKGEDNLLEPPHPKPKLHCGEKYYYNEHDSVTFGYFWNDTDWDFGRLAIGNVFVTENAAKFAAERLKVLAQMREWAGNWNDPYRILYIDGRVESETVFVGRCISYGEIRFATEADAKNCIKAVGKDRLKKYYFGIPEDRGCCTSER